MSIKTIFKTNFKPFISTVTAVTYTSLMSSPVMAASFSLNSNTTADQIGNSLIEKVKVPLRVFGGVAIVFSLAYVAFTIITTSSRPEKRQEAMGRLPWIAGGSFALGSLTIIASFLYGLGS